MNLEQFSNTLNKYPNLKCEWLEITPKIAKSFLEGNSKNRNTRSNRIESYTNQIKNKRWLPTNDAISFDEKGTLLNGQHRLHAIIKSETPIVCLVVSGLPEDSFKVMDRGGTRNPGDLFSIAGIAKSRVSAAIIRSAEGFLEVWDQRTSDFSIDRKISADDLLDVALGIKEELEETARVSMGFKNLSSPSELGGFLLAIGKLHYNEVLEIFNRANDGLMITGNSDPSYHIRNTLYRKLESGRGRVITDNNRRFLLSKVIFNFLKGTPLSVARDPLLNEKLPRLPNGWRADLLLENSPSKM